MSEEIKKNETELNDQELNDVNGGYRGFYPPPFAPEPVYYKPRPVYFGYCNECAIKGEMTVPAYSVPGTNITFCREVGHIYRDAHYDHTDKAEAESYFN